MKLGRRSLRLDQFACAVSIAVVLLPFAPLSYANPMMGQYSLARVFVNDDHPDVQLCRIPRADKVVANNLRVQFRLPLATGSDVEKATAAANTAAELLTLMTHFLNEKNHFWVSFAAKENHNWCSHRRVDDFNFLYRRNHDDSWILVPGRAHKAMRKQLEALSDNEDRLNKISLLLAMGDAYNSLPRVSSATKALEQAFALAKLPGVPVSLRDRAARSLMKHYYGQTEDPSSGDAILGDYAIWQYHTQPTTDRPEILFLPQPVYPKAAVKERLEGWVVLEFTVGLNGAASDIVVADSSIPAVFDGAAKRTMQRFRYVPKVVDGKVVSQRGVKNRITFELAE